jgi:7,8-dihydro-6-hydroxymethylpterin-pyrophosphokinase
MIDTKDCFLETYGLKLPHYEEKNSEFTIDNWFQCASIMFVRKIQSNVLLCVLVLGKCNPNLIFHK